VVDLEFTAEMEQKLDSVEGGEHSWVDVLREFWVPFKEQLEKVEADVERLEVKDEPAGEDCDKCGRPMVIKRGRFGRFIACSGYPECKNTKPILEKTGVICPKCQKDIVARRSKRGKVFYGCSGYPDCDFVVWQKPWWEAHAPTAAVSWLNPRAKPRNTSAQMRIARLILKTSRKLRIQVAQSFCEC
jgi:DNA topoisomerase-1